MYNFKENYLNELEKALKEKSISKKEISEILRDYDEMYEEAKGSGYKDEEIYNRLGNPTDIASDIGGSFVDDINPYSKSKRGNILVATSPFVATVAFLLIGFLGDLWNPGWLVFMWIPISGIFFGSRKSFIHKLSSASPFIALIAFMILGHFHLWHPGWVVWLLIPILGSVASFYTEQTRRNNR